MNDNVDKIMYYVCNNCGAKILAEESMEITKCEYCRSEDVSRSHDASNFSKIIPFKQTKESFMKRVYDHFAKDPLVKKQLLNAVINMRVSAFYLPFDKNGAENTDKNYIANEKENTLNRSITSLKKYKNTEIYTETKVKSLYVEDHFDKTNAKIFYAMKRLILECLPYDYREITKISNDLFKEHFGIYTKEDFLKEKPSNNLVDYVWVPIFLGKYKYDDEIYVVIMNGQTGEIAGIFNDNFYYESDRETKRDMKQRNIKRYFYTAGIILLKLLLALLALYIIHQFLLIIKRAIHTSMSDNLMMIITIISACILFGFFYGNDIKSYFKKDTGLIYSMHTSVNSKKETRIFHIFPENATK